MDIGTVHGLSVGDEVDYNVVDGFWILARVESCSVDGGILLLRFSCGLREVSHCLSLRRPQDARRIGPAGMRSIPMLDRQPVDVLRRTAASGVLGASEQWQRGEVVTTTNGVISYGGDRSVAVRITSTGDSLLGVTYGVGSSGSRGSAPTAAPAHGRASSGSNAGVEEWPPRRPMQVMGAAATLVLADPSQLAPGGCFGKWVPTRADVEAVTLLTPPPNVVQLSRRARAVFQPCAEAVARFQAEGRTHLRDFDLVDLLPRAKRRRPTSNSALVAALARVYGPTLGHVGQRLEERASSVIDMSAGLGSISEADGVFLDDIPEGEEGSFGDGFSFDGEGEAGDGAGGGAGAGSGKRGNTGHAAVLKGLTSRKVVVRQWYCGRIRLLDPAAGAAATSHAAGIAGAGKLGSGAASSASAGLGSSSSSSSSSALKPYVYWFEPALAADGVSLVPILRHAPVSEMLCIAPAGTYTAPMVPGMRVEARRLGGRWASAEVVYADRFVVRLRAPARLPRISDLNATNPKAVAMFAKEASPMKVQLLHKKGGSISGSFSIAVSKGSAGGGAAAQASLLAAAPTSASSAASSSSDVAHNTSALASTASAASDPAASEAAASAASAAATASASASASSSSSSAGLDRAARVGMAMRGATAPAAAAAEQTTQEPMKRGRGASLVSVLHLWPDKHSRGGAGGGGGGGGGGGSSSTAVSAKRSSVGGATGAPAANIHGLDVEVIPHQMWQHLISRAGFYCSRDDGLAAPPSALGHMVQAPVGPVPGSAAARFGLTRAPELSAGAVAAAAAYVAAEERQRRRSIFG